MKMVKLRNGTTEAKPFVDFVSGLLQKLDNEDPMVFVELVMLCRDSTHELFDNAGKVLKQFNFLRGDETQPHESVRNVVLSAVRGEGISVTLGNPVAHEGDKNESN